MVATPQSTNALQHLVEMIYGKQTQDSVGGGGPAQTIDVGGVQSQVAPGPKVDAPQKSPLDMLLGQSGGATMPIMNPSAWMKQGAGNFMPMSGQVPGMGSGSGASQGKGGIFGSQGGSTGKGGGASGGVG